jgi:hypothetical protein
MGLFTDLMIRREREIWSVHEVLSGSEDASSMVIGEIRRVSPFGTWAFITREEECELDLIDLGHISSRLAELEEADRGKTGPEMRAGLERMLPRGS